MQSKHTINTSTVSDRQLQDVSASKVLNATVSKELDLQHSLVQASAVFDNDRLALQGFRKLFQHLESIHVKRADDLIQLINDVRPSLDPVATVALTERSLDELFALRRDENDSAYCERVLSHYLEQLKLLNLHYLGVWKQIEHCVSLYYIVHVLKNRFMSVLTATIYYVSSMLTRLRLCLQGEELKDIGLQLFDQDLMKRNKI
ncbi:hypothetical protein MP228_009033 [Amoeboaphelidium protococcarum]|nr:hypothetical protein MP228_009033 [Amoeboaphelidium protococcarum]